MLTTLRAKLTRNSLIGLDVGVSVARAAEVRRGETGFEILRTMQFELARDDEGQLDMAANGDRCRRSLRQQGISGRRVVAGIGPPEAELHALELPAQSETGTRSQVEQAARLELNRLMRCEAADVQVGHWWLPEGRSGGPCAIGVAASRVEVTRLYELCRSGKAECHSVDTFACALGRFGWAARGGTRARRDDIWGLLDIGHRGTRVVLCIGHVPVLTRSFATGGEGWTQSIAEWLDISRDSAEIHKRDHGVTLDARDGRPGQGPPSNQIGGMIFSVLRKELDTIASQIERSYAYVLQCYRQHEAGELILVGGGANLRNLATYLSEKLGITVRDADQAVRDNSGTIIDGRRSARLRNGLGLDTTDGPSHHGLTEFACAIGLAMRPEVNGE